MPPAAGARELPPVMEIPHLVIDGPATLTLVELPQPVSASRARQPARMGLVLRARRVRHNIRNELRPTEPICNPGDFWRVFSVRGDTEFQRRREPSSGIPGALRRTTLTIRRAEKLGGKADDLLRARSFTPNCPNGCDHRQGRYADGTCARTPHQPNESVAAPTVGVSHASGIRVPAISMVLRPRPACTPCRSVGGA